MALLLHPVEGAVLEDRRPAATRRSGMSRKAAMRRICPGMSRFRFVKCTSSTLGRSRIAHQLRTFSQNGQNGWPSRSIQSRQYWRTSAGGRLDRRPDAPGRVVERVVPHLVRVDVVVVHAPHDVAAVAPDVDVLRLRREDEGIDREVRLQESPVRLRLDSGSFTSFGGTRRSSQGDISATSSSGSAAEQQLRDRSAASTSCRTSRRSR